MRRSGRARAAVGAMAALFALSALPGLTGITLHEWIGLAVTAAFLGHGAVRLGRLRGCCRAAAGAMPRVHAALDGLILLAWATCAVSGLLVSATVLPAFGLYAEGYYWWDPLHAMAAKALLVLILAHAALHLPQMLPATPAMPPGCRLRGGLGRGRRRRSARGRRGRWSCW